MVRNILGIGKGKRTEFHPWLGDRIVLLSDGSSCVQVNLLPSQNFEKVNIDNHMDYNNCINSNNCLNNDNDRDNNNLLTLEMVGRWKKPILPIF